LPVVYSKEHQVLRRAWKYVIGVPVAIVLLTLAVINRHGVRLVLDPFRPEEPVLFLVLPFYVYLIGMLVIGIVIGGIATWVTQARWRRSARRRGAEAQRWQAEADRLGRERQAAVAADRQLAAANR
jgi:uncharacterized integral membrane protein